MSKFKEQVLKVVREIPYGKVMSYGQVALAVGLPRAARQVGWVLNSSGQGNSLDIPWWRVVNNKGRISIKGAPFSANEQKLLLEKEGVLVNDDLTFAIDAYRYYPNSPQSDKFILDPFYLTKISGKVGYNK